jgi:hypothetical protein
MLFQQVRAIPKGPRQVEPGNAPTGSSPEGSVAAQDEGWPVELAQHPRSDYPDDADVPGRISLHDDQIALWVEAVSHAFSRLLGDAFLDLLTLAIL